MTDYFAALRAPTVPTTSAPCGDGANPHEQCVSPQIPLSPHEKTNGVKSRLPADPAAPCTTCGCGSFWHAADGWHCETCEPAPATVTRWRTVSGGTVAPIPAPAVPWPPELTDTLRRVARHFEWTRQDVEDFRQWARRSPEALADAAESLRAWAAET